MTGKPNEIAIVDDNLVETNKAKYISEAYHKAKADGSNPELVISVEELIGKPKEETPNIEDWSRDVESTAKALEGKSVSDLSKLVGIEPSEKISDSEDFETASKAILTEPNKGIANLMLIVTGKQIGRAHV